MKINGILLAAGKSSRFNGNKLLTEFNKKPLISHMIDKAKEVAFNDMVIVTGHHEIQEIANQYKIRPVLNHYTEKGLSYSVQLGIKESLECDAYMFMVCDQPYLSLHTIKQMMDMFSKSEKGIICAGYASRLGNPCIFSCQYKEKFLNLSGDIGGRKIIQNNLEDVCIYKVQNEIELLDVDTASDFQRAVQAQKNKGKYGH